MKYMNEYEKRKCEINEKLEELERAEFMINMSDRFTAEERQQLNKIRRERNILKNELRMLDKR